MNWFDKWIENKYKKMQHVKEAGMHVNRIKADRDIPIQPSSDIDVDGMRFAVMIANGGVILQMRTQSRHIQRGDEVRQSTYVIPDGEPVAERIGQIVSMEILKL